MTKILLILNICFLFSFRQVYPQDTIDFHSPQNVRLFADYLFCQKDYLRAADEYREFLTIVYNDTVDFKVGLAFQKTGTYNQSLIHFNHIAEKSYFYPDAKKETARTFFLKKDFSSLNNDYIRTNSSAVYYPFLKRLNYVTYFYGDSGLPPEDELISAFPSAERKHIENFYEWKNDPPYKSPLLAGLLSAVIPGLGKVYTENYTDGLFAAFLTGVFGYISYTNFKADHQVRAWIFTGVTAFFYAGNVYGSAASAQIYNAKIRFNFELEVHDFLDAFHYLSGEYNFCQ